MKKKIFCDIDNTVLDQYSEMKKYYNFQIKKLDVKLFKNRNLQKDKPIPGAAEAINSLSSFYDIVWLSARDKNLYNQTELWLQNNNFAINKIILVESHDKKIKILRNSDCYVFIDDLKYNYENLEPKPMTRLINKLEYYNIRYIVFNNNWAELVKLLS
ncbi:MAG: hypothetical protein CMG62_09595 [Candidatus Marinimicrobia bacterium]|nr:hypothetical protein [Candidatus Neomarinimicrobiota bacterium]|tara:strand:- start:3760 stop:4233 length:474 start_codon:yes stop_codon:yes gene_type:complete